FAAAAPDEIGLERHDRVASAPRAALDRFEEERVGPIARDLQICGDRRFEIVDDAAPDHLGGARLEARAEGLKRGLDAHLPLGAGVEPSCCAPIAAIKRSLSTLAFMAVFACV